MNLKKVLVYHLVCDITIFTKKSTLTEEVSVFTDTCFCIIKSSKKTLEAFDMALVIILGIVFYFPLRVIVSLTKKYM